MPAASHISIITVHGTAVDSAGHLSNRKEDNNKFECQSAAIDERNQSTTLGISSNAVSKSHVDGQGRTNIKHKRNK